MNIEQISINTQPEEILEDEKACKEYLKILCFVKLLAYYDQSEELIDEYFELCMDYYCNTEEDVSIFLLRAICKIAQHTQQQRIISQQAYCFNTMLQLCSSDLKPQDICAMLKYWNDNELPVEIRMLAPPQQH